MVTVVYGIDKQLVYWTHEGWARNVSHLIDGDVVAQVVCLGSKLVREGQWHVPWIITATEALPFWHHVNLRISFYIIWNAVALSFPNFQRGWDSDGIRHNSNLDKLPTALFDLNCFVSVASLLRIRNSGLWSKNFQGYWWMLLRFGQRFPVSSLTLL